MNGLKPLAKRVASSVLDRLPSRMRSRIKEHFELRYWNQLHEKISSMPREQQHLQFIHERSHYEYFYTHFFGVDAAQYNGKKVLDIGCGPMGSLEWADQASVRIGLDPLAKEYRSLGTTSHRMAYAAAASEYIPFADETFDFVASFNSLDHVDDVYRTVEEMKRVTATRGLILIITEIQHTPTLTEPHRLDFSVTNSFCPEFTIESVRVFGIRARDNLYSNLFDSTPYEEGRPGLLCARMRKG